MSSSSSRIPKNQPLTNIDIERFAKALKIPNFRGVFMRNTLPKTIRQFERGVVNLDNRSGSGTHWVAYKKIKNKVIYFDSYGNLQPPLELLIYFNSSTPVTIIYNREIFQTFNSVNCGQLCLKFLIGNM